MINSALIAGLLLGVSVGLCLIGVLLRNKNKK